MKELELRAVESLIYIYSKYLDSDKLDQEQVAYAKEIYDGFVPASTLLSKEVNGAVGALFSLAYPKVNSGLPKLTKAHVEKMLISLNNLKTNLIMKK